TCGRACWRPTGGGAGVRHRRWSAISSCAGSWRRPGRARSGSWTPPVPGRCCAATRMPGSRPPSAARPATVRCGFARRRRRLLPVRFYHGTFRLRGRRVRLPTGVGCPPLWLRLDRDLPYPPEAVRSVSLLAEGGRLWLEVTAELPVAVYPAGHGPDPARVAGVDLGVIHPYAVAGPDGAALLVSGRAIRAEYRMHLADTKARRKATGSRVPQPGQRGSRRWGKTRRPARLVEGRHRRRVRQAQHEAA